MAVKKDSRSSGSRGGKKEERLKKRIGQCWREENHFAATMSQECEKRFLRTRCTKAFKKGRSLKTSNNAGHEPRQMRGGSSQAITRIKASRIRLHRFHDENEGRTGKEKVKRGGGNRDLSTLTLAGRLPGKRDTRIKVARLAWTGSHARQLDVRQLCL